MYYMFCVEMKQPEEVFFKSSLSKVVKTMELYSDFRNPEGIKSKPVTVKSMKEIPGW